MRFVLTLLIILIMATTVSADVTVKKYKKLMKDDTGKTLMEAYIDGVGVAYGWANTELEETKREPLFCPPKKLVLYATNYIDILDREIDSWEKMMKELNIEKESEKTIYIELLLLEGLKEAFPCKKNK